MQKLNEGCEHHLKKALDIDDPQKKNYHIRQVLQLSSIDDIPEGFEPDLTYNPEEAIK